MEERRLHRASEGREGRSKRPATGMGSPEHLARARTSPSLTRLGFLRAWTQRGAARAREPALLTSGAMDGGATSASSERRPGRPKQASGDGHGQTRAPRARPHIPIAHAIGLPEERSVRVSPALTRLGFLSCPQSRQGATQPARRTSSTRRIASSTSQVASARTTGEPLATQSPTAFCAAITVEWLRRPK